MMLTVTVDPLLFPDGPKSAWEHVRARCAVARLVGRLHRSGWLNDRRYFFAMETQDNGWPHWHILVDSNFVPFDVLARLWAEVNWSPKRFGPMPAIDTGKGNGKRPVFGSVRFTARGKNSVVNYVVKYLTKPPFGGVPDWILVSRVPVRRFSCSRDFWRVSWEPVVSDPDAEHKSGLDEWESILNAPGSEKVLEPIFRDQVRRPAKERIASCGSQTVLLRERLVRDPALGLVAKWEFLGVVRDRPGATALWADGGWSGWESAEWAADKHGFYVSTSADRCFLLSLIDFPGCDEPARHEGVYCEKG
jgi:hypothetical protein